MQAKVWEAVSLAHKIASRKRPGDLEPLFHNLARGRVIPHDGRSPQKCHTSASKMIEAGSLNRG